MKELMPILIVGVLLISGISSLASIVHTDENYDLIIITPTSFSDDLQPLIEHKEQHAVATKIVTLEEVYSSVYFPVEGRDDAEQIKYFIRNAIESWNISYVMLVGGKEQMPVRYSNIYSLYSPSDNIRGVRMPVRYSNIYFSNNSWSYISDLYYADIYDANGSFCSWDSNNNSVFGEKNDTTIIDKVDLFPDVYIGRILCSNSLEVTTVVNKIIIYENNVFNKPWFNNLILCGGDTHPTLWEIMFKLVPFSGKKARIAWEGEHIGDRVAEYLDSFNAKKIYASGLIRINAKMLTKKNINEAISDGAGFLLFSGHGMPSYWGTHFPFCKWSWLPYPSGYTSSDVQNLTNGEKLPVAVFNACLCGDFNVTSSPIAWEFVKHGNGGAIACFSCTVESFGLQSSLCTETLDGHLTMGIFKSYSEGEDIIGKIWSDTIVNYLNDEDAISLGNLDPHRGWANHLTVEQWILFGDPSLKIGGYAE